MRGLIIRTNPLNNILGGRKTWEIRGSRTKIRGTIGLIESGTGTIVGCCELVDCLGPLSLIEMQHTVEKHGIPLEHLENNLPYPYPYAWVLAKARRLKRPKPYDHPLGAIIWVKIKKLDDYLD
jgi:hypothetical protein